MKGHLLAKWVRPLVAVLCAVAFSALPSLADVTIWVYGSGSTAPNLFFSGTASNTTSGSKMTSHTYGGNTWYYTVLEGVSSTTIHFATNSSNANQTNDISSVSGTNYFYYSGSNGRYVNLTDIKDYKSFVFVDKSGGDYWWNDANAITKVYAWGGTGSMSFPGEAVETSAVGKMNKDGNDIYVWKSNTVEDPANVILDRCDPSNPGNSWNKTSDLTYHKGGLYVPKADKGDTDCYQSLQIGNVSYPTSVPVATTYSATLYIYSTTAPTMSGVTFAQEANDNSDDTKDALFNWYKGTYSNTTWSGTISFTANGSTKTLTLGSGSGQIADGSTHYFNASNTETDANYNPFANNSFTIYVKGQTDPLLHAWVDCVNGTSHNITANNDLVWNQDATNDEKLTQTQVINGYTWYKITLTGYPAIKATAYKTGIGSAQLNSGSAISSDWYFGFTGHDTNNYDAATPPAAPVTTVVMLGGNGNWSTGTQMNTSDHNVFTLSNITFAETKYFRFKETGVTNLDLAPTTDGKKVVRGTAMPLSDDTQYNGNAYKLPAGTYSFSVNYSQKTVTVTGTPANVYLLTNAGGSWAYNTDQALTKSGTTFTISNVTLHTNDLFVLSTDVGSDWASSTILSGGRDAQAVTSGYADDCLESESGCFKIPSGGIWSISYNASTRKMTATRTGAIVYPDRYIHGDFGEGWVHNLNMTSKGDGTYTYERTLTANQTIYFFASDSDSDDWSALDGHRYAEGVNQTIYENRVTTCVPVSNGTYVFTAGVAGNYIFTYDGNNNTMVVEREKTHHAVRIYIYDRNGQADHLLLYAYRNMVEAHTKIGPAWPGVSFNNQNTEVINGQTWYYMDLDIEDDQFAVIPNLTTNGTTTWKTTDLVVSAFYDAWYIAVDTSQSSPDSNPSNDATYYVKNTEPTSPVPPHWYIKADWGDGNNWQGTEELTSVSATEFSITKHLNANQTAFMFIADVQMAADVWTQANRYAAAAGDTDIEIGSTYDVTRDVNGNYKFKAPANKQYTFIFNSSTMKFRVEETVGKAVIIHLEKTANVTNPQIWAWDKERLPDGTQTSVDRPSISEMMTDPGRYAFTYEGNNLFHLADYKSPEDGREWYTWEVDNNICEFVLTRNNTTLSTSNYGNSSDVTDIQWRRSGEIFITWDDQLGLVNHTRDYDTNAATEAPTAARMLEGHYYVYFINTQDWPQAYIHAWYTDSQGLNHPMLPVGNAKYPGQRMSEIVGYADGHEVYLFDFGFISNWENEPDGILFSIGDATGGLQSSDFVFSNGGVYDYTGNVVLGRSLGYIITNGVIGGAPYTIEDDLIGVYFNPDESETYRTVDGQTHTSYGALYCKDLNMFKSTPYVERSVQQEGQIDYVREKTNLMNHMNGRYDQSNWVKLTLSSQYPDYSNDPDEQRDILSDLCGYILTAGSVRGELVDKINPHIRLTHSDAGVGEGIVTGASSNGYGAHPNVYTTANFVGNQSSSRHTYFFVTPKPNEYAEVTWAVADNVTENSVDFYVPESMYSDHYDNEANLKGSFTANLDMLASGTFTAGQAYKFKAIITLDENAINNSSSNTGGSGIKRRINHGNGANNAYPYVVHPLEVGGTVTGVSDVKSGREVTNVTYVNMAGMQSSKPFDGVNIVVTTYSDGSRQAVKVLR